jgi:predicted DNA-binding transcriptional regulator YafY
MTRTKRISEKIARVLQIMEALRLEPDGIAVPDLARRFGVHRTTINRDIEAMQATGVNIFYANGRVYLAQKG